MDEEDEYKNEDKEEKKSFSILQTFGAYRFLHTIASIRSSISQIKRFSNNKLKPITDDINKIAVDDKLVARTKSLLLMNKFRDFMLHFCSPLIPKLYDFIIDFYNSEEIEKLFKKFEDWLFN